MNLNSKHKVEAAFSMSSMTDIIFLLLIFFMLTASFITPSGLPVNVPSSRSSEIVMQKVGVTITEDLQYYVNDRKVSINQLEAVLRDAFAGKRVWWCSTAISQFPWSMWCRSPGLPLLWRPECR